jgi:hypothetical protein
MRLKIVINDNVVKKAENSHCHSEELATRNLKHSLLLYISFYKEIPRCARDDNSDFLRRLTIDGERWAVCVDGRNKRL